MPRCQLRPFNKQVTHLHTLYAPLQYSPLKKLSGSFSWKTSMQTPRIKCTCYLCDVLDMTVILKFSCTIASTSVLVLVTNST